MNTSEGNFIQRNWQIVSAAALLIFSIGGLYTKDQIQDQKLNEIEAIYKLHLEAAKKEHQDIQQKQDQKWGDIPEIEQRVDDLEELHYFNEGYKQGLKEAKK